LIAFFKALAAVLNALVPLIEERTRHARIQRIKEGYYTRLEATADDPAAAFSAFDDELRSEGIVSDKDSGGGLVGDKKDRPKPLSGIKGLVD